jgi:uncharacterized protein
VKVSSNVVVFAIIVMIGIAAAAVKLTDLGFENGADSAAMEERATTTVRAISSLQTSTPPAVRIVYGHSSIRMPAVDEDGNGVVTSLAVDVENGEGRTLVNINQLLFWVDTQYSIQTAKAVAGNITSFNRTNADIVYTIDTEASLIEGPSAGAALTVATVAAMSNRTLDPTVMMTGTINPDGTIGEVGGILEKAKAAKEVGARLFIVPEGQSVQVTYSRQRKCQKIGPVNYCTTSYVPSTVNITQAAGITVIESSTVRDALKYFLS